MQERDVIRQLNSLKAIKPTKEWVFLTRQKILGKEEEKKTFGFFLKPALAFSVVALVLTSSFVMAQNSLPGDTLYSLKKISERARLTFAPEDEKPKIQLELTSERLNELKTIAKENKIDKLPSAIKEVKQAIPQATKSLKNIAKEDKSVKDMKEIVKKVDEVEKTKKEIETLGIIVGANGELQKTSQELRKEIISREFKDLSDESLTDSQRKLLEEAENYFKEGNYSKALETIFYLSNQNQ